MSDLLLLLLRLLLLLCVCLCAIFFWGGVLAVSPAQVDTVLAGLLVFSLIGKNHEQIARDDQKVQVRRV